VSPKKATNYIMMICGCLCILVGYIRGNKGKAKRDQDKEQVRIIEIQPFSGIPKSHIDFLNQHLKKIYPHIIVKEAIQLPANTYYKPRNRYRADSLIRYLRNRTDNGHITIGLTDMDISHTKGSVKDYGIMGLGYLSGRACIISTYRLSKDSLLSQFFKLALHELGHNNGLPHCEQNTCLMRDAEGKNHFNKQIGFCKSCKTHLINMGWKL
jgi:archaemetzincin